MSIKKERKDRDKKLLKCGNHLGFEPLFLRFLCLFAAIPFLCVPCVLSRLSLSVSYLSAYWVKTPGLDIIKRRALKVAPEWGEVSSW